MTLWPCRKSSTATSSRTWVLGHFAMGVSAQSSLHQKTKRPMRLRYPINIPQDRHRISTSCSSAMSARLLHGGDDIIQVGGGEHAATEVLSVGQEVDSYPDEILRQAGLDPTDPDLSIIT